jgi:hypothetical protein
MAPLNNAANRRIQAPKSYSYQPAPAQQSAMYQPAGRGPQVDAGPVGTIAPMPPSTPTNPNPTPINGVPNLTPNNLPSASVGAVRGPTTVEDITTYQPGEYAGRKDGTYLQDSNGNFLEGDADAYVRDKLGIAPNVAPVDPTQASAIEGNYMNELANLDVADQYARNNFTEQEGLIGRNKTKSLGSLADSMADRGLSNSGIFLGATGEVNTAATEQLGGASKSRDMILTQNQSGRTNSAKTRADALAKAQADALSNAIKNWSDNYNQQLEIARQRNAAVLAGGA